MLDEVNPTSKAGPVKIKKLGLDIQILVFFDIFLLDPLQWRLNLVLEDLVGLTWLLVWYRLCI